MLTALAVLLLGLVVLAACAPVLARLHVGGVVVHGGCLGAAVLFAVLGFAALLLDGDAAVLALPVGWPWGAATLALDGLSAWFLMVLGVAGAVPFVYALGQAPSAQPARLLVPVPLFLAGMALTLLAADGVTLLFGFEAMSLASWALVAAEHERAENRAAARLYLIFAGVGAACLILALGLLGAGGELGFAALRERPPEGWRAAAVLLLAVAGAGAKAGLVPLHVWLPPAHAAAPGYVSALLSAAMTKAAVYVLARVVLDLGGPAQPVWWAAPLLAVGAASAVLGALRANLEEDTKTLLACSTIEHVGLITVGLGLAAAFRAADQGALAALAAGAALLHALHHAVFKTGLFLAAGEVLRGAASRRLDRLGGLVRAMPRTAACALVVALGAAALPPLSGFASEWLLLQALLAAWRVGDLAFQLGAAAVTALAALAAALGAAAMVRMYGLVFLGRPRTPRAAGAEEPAARSFAGAALLVPAGLTVLLGLLPGPMLDLADPALRVLVGGAGAAPRAGAFSIGLGDGAARYAPLAVAVLLGLAGWALVWGVRRRAPAGVARGPAWDGGFAAPPMHLPFGDPLTQPSAAGLGQPLRRMLGAPLLGGGAEERVEAAALAGGEVRDPALRLLLAPLARARDALADQAERLRGLTIRQCLSLTFGALVGLLALVAWLEAG